MSARKRKDSDEPAITVHKKSRGTRSPKPPPEAQSGQGHATNLIQEDLFIIISIECDHRNRRAGFEHYLNLQGKQPQREPICDRISTKRYNYTEMEESAFADVDEQAFNEAIRARSPSADLKFDLPPTPRYSYFQPTFAATTQNPAVFLAITRVAQRNLPFLNFDSAMNHLPNFPAAATLPKLRHGVFVDDIKYEMRKENHEMQVLFLPQYYDDRRHAIGYYALSSDRRGKYVSTCLFTPCTDMDLGHYNLVDYFHDRRVNASIGEETEWTANVKAVAARNGQWLECDVVEDWDKWALGLRIVGDIWKTRFGLTTGEGEGGERWKP